MNKMNQTTIKIRGYHLDMFGHVNNTRYLEFLEEGRWDYLLERPEMDMGKWQASFIVVNININYRSSALFGEEIEVASYIESISNKSAKFKQIIRNKKDGMVRVDALVTFVLKGNQTGRAIEMPEEFKKVVVSEEELTSLK